jgi:transglutaminase-like putative cysteine protease
VIYRVRHRTTYTYDAPVTFARCRLRLTPQDSSSQTVHEHRITVTPAPAQTVRRTGPFNEEVLALIIETPHLELIVDAASRVEVKAPHVDDLEDSPAWESIREESFASAGLGGASPAAYLYPTARTPILPALTDYGRQSFAAGRPILEAAAELTRRIRADFAYETGVTSVSTPPGEAFAARRGVCQDFANIMICALRGLGLPASYVSGYLRTVPPPGRPRLEGADATHAWVRVWCGPSRGWIGFDPTNAILVQDDHITLTAGRDYADVAPIDGVMLASGAQALKVEVDVLPEDETSIVRAAFGAASRVGGRR